MNIDEARRIAASRDMTDLPKALLAVATMLRFHGIVDKRLVPLAEAVEKMAAGMPAKGNDT